MDPRAVQRDIVLRILAADDFDAALDMADTGALSMEDISEQPFSIDGISWHRSAEGFREGGLGIFALLGVTMRGGPLEGKQVAVTAGGVNVLASLKKGVEAGAIPDPDPEKPRWFRLVPRGTSAGFTTYWLGRA